MTNINFKKTMVICLAVGGISISSCSNSQNKPSEHQHQQSVSAENIYACPMHPEVTGKQGDKCSKCGMGLELVKARQKKDLRN